MNDLGEFLSGSHIPIPPEKPELLKALPTLTYELHEPQAWERKQVRSWKIAIWIAMIVGVIAIAALEVYLLNCPIEECTKRLALLAPILSVLSFLLSASIRLCSKKHDESDATLRVYCLYQHILPELSKLSATDAVRDQIIVKTTDTIDAILLSGQQKRTKNKEVWAFFRRVYRLAARSGREKSSKSDPERST